MVFCDCDSRVSCECGYFGSYGGDEHVIEVVLTHEMIQPSHEYNFAQFPDSTMTLPCPLSSFFSF